MQSKILDFQIEGIGDASLFGDFGSLPPMTIHGIAHAFRNGSNVVITVYSDTGIEADGKRICSADLRLSVDHSVITTLIAQLSKLDATFFGKQKPNSSTDHESDVKSDGDPATGKKIEKLGPAL